MTPYDALKDAWVNDARLSGLDEQARLAAINSWTVTGPRQPVNVDTLVAFLWAQGMWQRIAAAAATSPGAAAAVSIEGSRVRSIDFDLAQTKMLLADIVGRGVVTQAEADSIDALANTALPWWRSVGFASAVHVGDLALAGIQPYTKWQYTVLDVTVNVTSGATVATVKFDNTGNANQSVTRTLTSQGLTARDLAAWAVGAMRELARQFVEASSIAVNTPTQA